MRRLGASRSSRLRTAGLSGRRTGRPRGLRARRPGRLRTSRPGRRRARRPRRLRTGRAGGLGASRAGRLRTGRPRRLRRRGGRTRGRPGRGRWRGGAGHPGNGCAARRRHGRPVVRPASMRVAVAIQVVAAHEANEVRAVVGVGGVHTGECGREPVRVLTLRHGVLVVATSGQEPAVVVDALGRVVIDAEGRRGANRLPVHVLLGGHRHAARRAGALDTEQVVLLGGQLALSPP